ncbi:hypothetical protein M758_12G073900 [Ceratodon purpureus]|nr:hypothetical protein M758_12G073900 [Ceratodon purpureus]
MTPVLSVLLFFCNLLCRRASAKNENIVYESALIHFSRQPASVSDASSLLPREVRAGEIQS